MGCNCGNKNSSFNYRYTSPTGNVTVYTSEVQAKAAVIKNKGGTYLKVAK